MLRSEVFGGEETGSWDCDEERIWNGLDAKSYVWYFSGKVYIVRSVRGGIFVRIIGFEFARGGREHDHGEQE